MTATTTNKLEALRTKRDAIHAEGKRIEVQMRARLRDVQKRLSKLDMAIRRTEVSGWMGQSVRLRYRMLDGHPQVRFNGATGTLIDLKRTRCVIDFGDLGMLNARVDEITHADDQAEDGVILSL